MYVYTQQTWTFKFSKTLQEQKWGFFRHRLPLTCDTTNSQSCKGMTITLLVWTVLQLLAQSCEKLKILATGFQQQPLSQSSFSCLCRFYQKPPHTLTAYWAACPLPLHVPVLGTLSWVPLPQRILPVHQHVDVSERILQDFSLVHASEDSDCYQTSRQQAPCSATCQRDGCQKALLDVCSNKTVVSAAVVSVQLWALKTRLLRSHNTASRTWNVMGVTAGATAPISTVSEISLYFLRKTMHFTSISRSEQCPQPEGYESQDNSCRVNLIFAKQGWKMKLGL